MYNKISRENLNKKITSKTEYVEIDKSLIPLFFFNIRR